MPRRRPPADQLNIDISSRQLEWRVSGRAIALCSDAHAQSINLPAASAVVFLDFPTVPRLAEQRVGRVDRLDSPHSSIGDLTPAEKRADYDTKVDTEKSKLESQEKETVPV